MRSVLKLMAVLLVVLASMAAWGQGAPISGQIINQFGQPLPYAKVRICSVTATDDGTGCTPVAAIYQDYTLSGTPLPNPYGADQYGNYTVYVPALASPNLYVVQLVPASGITWSYVVSGPSSGGGGGGVTTFNARAGAVVPASGDYSFALLSGSLGTTQGPSLTGILKDAAGTLSAAVAADFPILNQSTTGNAATATLAANSSAVGGVPLSGLCQTGGTGCPATGTLSGQVPGWAVEAATLTTATGPFPMDDEMTAVGFVTIHKNVKIAGTGPANGWQISEGTAVPGGTTVDSFWADAAAQRLMMNNHNTGALMIPGIATAIPVGHLLAAGTNGIDPVDGGAAAAPSVTNNILNTDIGTSKFISVGPSEGLIIEGGYPEKMATALGIPSGNWNITSIGSSSGPDWLSCSNSICSTAGAVYQNGVMPVTFPLGVTNLTKVLLYGGFNDVSAWSGSPTTAQLDYFRGHWLAWSILYGVPDAQKLTASASCTVTAGSFSAAGAGFPSGALTTTTNGSQLTCTNFNANDAGVIFMKKVSDTATFTLTVNGASVLDPSTSSSTIPTSAPYTGSLGGTSDLYAVGTGVAPNTPLTGGLATIVLTVTAASGGNPVTVVAPYVLTQLNTLANSPPVVIGLAPYQCGNGAASATCVSPATNHTDAQINQVRTQQLAVVSELRGLLNIGVLDMNASLGMNPNSVFYNGAIKQITVTAGGSGFGTPVVTFTGVNCTIQPTMVGANLPPVSGGALVTGTYYVTTSGACTAAPTITITGGSGATATAIFDQDFVHPNENGGTAIAALGQAVYNSASRVIDKFTAASFPTTTCSSGYSLSSFGPSGGVCSANSIVPTACGTGFAHHAAITLATATGGVDLTNFPILLGFNGATTNSVTLTNLKTVANSGQVQSSTGLDVIFCTAASGGTQLSHELVAGSYVPTTGAGEWYVKVPTVSHTAGTSIVAFWGNASAADTSAVAAVWSPRYAAVYHGGTSASLALTDSTSNANILTNTGATAASSPFGGGFGVTTSTHLTNASAVGVPSGSAQRTVEGWANITAGIGTDQVPFGYGNAGTGGEFSFDYYANSPSYLLAATSPNDTYAFSGTTLTTGTWHSLTAILPTGTGAPNTQQVYVDGLPVTSSPTCLIGACTTAITTVAANIEINGAPGSPSSAAINGTVDEVRISNIASTAAWVAYQYANQSNPSTSLTVGTIF